MKSKSTVCEEIVSPRYLPKHGRNERKVLNRTVCLLNLSNKFQNITGALFIPLMYKIQIFNCICVLYFVYFKYLGRDEVGIQRYNGRGKTGLGKWEHAIQLFCRYLHLFSSSAFGIAGMREEAAGLQ